MVSSRPACVIHHQDIVQDENLGDDNVVFFLIFLILGKSKFNAFAGSIFVNVKKVVAVMRLKTLGKLAVQFDELQVADANGSPSAVNSRINSFAVYVAEDEELQATMAIARTDSIQIFFINPTLLTAY